MEFGGLTCEQLTNRARSACRRYRRDDEKHRSRQGLREGIQILVEGVRDELRESGRRVTATETLLGYRESLDALDELACARAEVLLEILDAADKLTGPCADEIEAMILEDLVRCRDGATANSAERLSGERSPS